MKTINLYRFTVITHNGDYFQSEWQSDDQYDFDSKKFKNWDFADKVVKTEVKEVMVEE